MYSILERGVLIDKYSKVCHNLSACTEMTDRGQSEETMMLTRPGTAAHLIFPSDQSTSDQQIFRS